MTIHKADDDETNDGSRLIRSPDGNLWLIREDRKVEEYDPKGTLIGIYELKATM